jgi:hypothetical protein
MIDNPRPSAVEVAAMDLVLLDWTRMGHVYCLAGAVREEGQYRIVRPLLGYRNDSPVPNQGWSPYLMDGHSRWEVFELVHPVRPLPVPPHVEDVWVKTLEPRRRSARRDERRAILQATLGPPDAALFGAALLNNGHGGCYLEPGSGERSLASLVVPSSEIRFKPPQCRGGADQPDYHAYLTVPGHGECILPVKDHFLLCRAEKAWPNLDDRPGFLTEAVHLMGHQVVVRLGLSRSFPTARGAPGRCWLMADGFFSLDDPQA